MAIDTDVQSFAEENANITDCNTKYTQLAPLCANTSLTSADNNKIPVRRSGSWSIEGEEAYNGYYQDFGNISGDVVLTMNGDSCRTAMIATVIGNTFITGFGANFLAGVVYMLFLKQNSTGGFSVRWPYGASILKSVGTNPDQMTEINIVKLPSGKVFIRCEAFRNTTDIGSVIKEFEFPVITYPAGSQAPMQFTWMKAPAVSYGGTLVGLFSDWEIADDALYTNLLFSSYNNTVDLYSIQVIFTQPGTVFMRTRHGGIISGTPVISPWDEVVVSVSGTVVYWTPSEINTDQWLDYYDSSTLTWVGSNLSVFADKSGNGRNATQTSDSNRPIDSSGLLNFDSTSKHMLMSVPQALPCHIFWIMDLSTLPNGTPLALINRTAISSPYPPGVYISGQAQQRPELYWGTGWVGAYSGDLIPKQLVLLELMMTANTVGWRLNGGTLYTYGHSQSALSNWIAFPSEYGPQSAIHKFGERLIINYAVNEDIRTRIEGYLTHKWDNILSVSTLCDSLPTGHTYKSTPPVI